jgi:3-phosphoglycerate kinase
MEQLSVRDLEVKGRRVLVRVDFNVNRGGRRKRPNHDGTRASISKG